MSVIATSRGSDREHAPASRSMRVFAAGSRVVATVLGAAMAVQWAISGRLDFDGGPPGAGTIGRWMAENLPLMGEGGEPLWVWRGPFFLSLAMILPLAWAVTGRVGSATARWSTRVGLLGATGAIALRRRTLPRPVAWALVAALPLTPVGGSLTFWYLPPGLAIGLLIAWAVAGVLWVDDSSRGEVRPAAG